MLTPLSPSQPQTNHRHKLRQTKSCTNNQQWLTTISASSQTNGSTNKTIQASTKRSQATFQSLRNKKIIGDQFIQKFLIYYKYLINHA